MLHVPQFAHLTLSIDLPTVRPDVLPVLTFEPIYLFILFHPRPTITCTWHDQAAVVREHTSTLHVQPKPFEFPVPVISSFTQNLIF